MIAQPNPHIEAQPSQPDIRESSHIPLPERPHLRPGTQGTHTTNIALAGFQLLVGYEWLLAGGDKILLGGFPTQLGAMLLTLVNGGHLVGFFTAILKGLVAPNAVFFGYLIEWGETLAGLGLMAAGLLALLRPFIGHYSGGKSAMLFAYAVRIIERLAPLAAIGAGLLGVSYFFLDGLPGPWFVPSIAFGGSIDTGLFLAAASVILVVGQVMQRPQSH